MRKYRRLIICLIISITALIAIPTIAVVVNLGNKCVSVTVTDSNRKYVTYIKQLSDGSFGYCLDEKLNSPNGMDMPVGSLVSDVVFRVLNFGYPNYSYTNSADTNYLITQFALWHILGQIDAGSLNYQADSSIQATGFRHTDYGSTYKGPLTGAYVKACIMDLITVAQVSPASQTASFGVSPKNSVGVVSGDYILSGSYTVNASGTSISNNGALKLTPSTSIPGLVIVKNGQTYDINSYNLKVGESFQLGVPKYTASGSVSFKVSGVVSARQVFTLRSTDSYVQNIAAYQTRSVDASVVDAFTFTWQKAQIKGTVRLAKKDSETKKMLAGAKFGLYSLDGKLVQEATTGSNGIATFAGVSVGSYDLKEIQPPVGYALNTNPIRVDIVDGTADVTLDFNCENTPLYHDITVVKKDSLNSDVLEGAKFGIYQNGVLLQEVTTNSTGIATFTNLKNGVYQIKELEAPLNYKLNTNVIDVDLTNATSVQNLSYDFTNEPYLHNIELTKTDSETGDVLADAIYGLYQNGNEITRATTDHRGKLTFSGLRPGSYTIKEIQPPVNYELSTEVFDVIVNKSTSVQTYTLDAKNSPIRHKIILTKEDSENGALLKDAEYGLYLNGALIDKGTTDESGSLTFNDLRTNNYIIKELTPPINYYLSDEELVVNMGDQTTSQTFNVNPKDTPIKHKVKVKKIDAISKESVSSCVFAIFQGDVELARATSDGEGIALFENLRPGSYTIKEVEVPANYLLNKEVINVEIGDATESKTYTFEFENAPILHNIIVYKTDRENGEPLSDTIFGVYEDGRLIRKGKTDENGQIKFTALLKGEYVIKELVAPINHLLDSEPQVLRIVNQSANQNFKVRFDNGYIPNTIVIIKKDSETKEVLAGATFALYQDGQEIARATSNEKGEAKFENLRNGNYTVKEVEPPVNFVLNDKELNIEIKDSTTAQTLTYDFEDAPIKHKLIVTKVDSENGNTLAGAKFGLYLGEERIDVGLTDENGQIVFENLRKGDYTLKELISPVGFRLNETDTEVSIGDNTEAKVYEATVQDAPIKFSLELYKREYFENNPIDGVKFRLVSDGRIVYFPIEENDTVSDTEETVKPDSDVIEKESIDSETIADESTESVVKDIVFSDVIEDETKLKSLDDSDAPEGMTSIFITDENGMINFPTKLRYGNYELIELEPKIGYKPLTESVKFTVNENTKMGDDLDNLVYTAVIENHIGEGEMELTKQDVSTGELLPNAKFKIYAEDKKTVVTKGITDENGIAKFKLEIGKYYYQEYEAPVGYELDDSLFEFEIKANNEIVKCQMTNTPTPIPPNIILPKTGAVGSVLPVVIGCALVSALCTCYIIIRKGSKK